jgi:hypothetical protein
MVTSSWLLLVERLEQLRQADAQGSGNLLDVLQRHVRFAALDPANESAMQAAQTAQRLLRRDARPFSQFTDATAELNTEVIR